MRRLGLLSLALALLGCGPRLPSGDDEVEVGAESESDTDTTTETESTETESTETGSTESESTDSETGVPPCPAELAGTLEITDETDLDTLACLVEAQWIYIEGSFADLSFLHTLERADAITITGAPALVDLGGLDSLQELDSLAINNAPSMVDLAGLPDDVTIDHLTIGPNNVSLASIAMPPQGARWLSFGGWDRPDLEILATASPAPLRIEIVGAPQLADLDDVAQCCLDQQEQLRITLSDTPLLTNLQGLEPFTTLGGFTMYANPSVASLAGLQNLESIGELQLSDHCDPIDGAMLTNLHGLEQLVEVGALWIWAQGGLVSLEGLPTQLAVEFATFVNNPQLDQSLIDAWIAAAMPASHDGCGNLNGLPCEGNCPQ